MKKRIYSSLLISTIINIVCLIINLVCALAFDMMPLALRLNEGESIEYIGFGIELLKIYPLTYSKRNFNINKELSFNLFSIIISFIIIFIIVFIIKSIIERNRKKNKSKV